VDDIARALEVVRKAESTLREIASEAATEGNYAAIIKLAAWGQQLSRLLTSMLAEEAEVVPRSMGTERVPADHEPIGTGVGGARIEEQRPKARRRNSDYPRFFRRSDQLVKVGWSKREKAEYQHKAPRQAVEAVVEALQLPRVDQDPLSIPGLLPLKTSAGEEIPPYQVYLCLAWFRKLGLIRQHGREGYTVGQPATLLKDVAAAWDALERLHSR
jgi:hypothetical protein